MAVARKLRLKVRSLAPLMLLTALAISLATFSLALAALSWVDCRSLSQSLQAWEDNSIQQQGDTPKLLESIRPDLPRDPGSPGVRLSFLQGLLESKRLTRIRRERRKASAAKNKQPFAAHFEVLPNNEGGTYIVENDGIIRKWLEKPLQVKNALSYNKTGEFIVLKDGLYYVYSQVHCDDNTTAYLKLEVKVDDAMAFRSRPRWVTRGPKATRRPYLSFGTAHMQPANAPGNQSGKHSAWKETPRASTGTDREEETH
ncbi:tumor necrosis factor ligand superfamily member 12 isoform X1 [Scyliorhinus canicula]|nr:tumor necrosis factor ligand superfamily member 12 isoform X1 [Scyliorhinus canicula]